MRVLLASASGVRRAGLETFVKSTPSLRLAGSLQSVQRIAHAPTGSHPDVALIDLDRESSLALSVVFPFPLVVLINNPDPSWTAQALRSGVKAMLSREADAKEILAAITAAHSGLVLLSPDITRSVVEHVRAPSQKPEEPLEELTDRELEVLGMLAEGLGNRQIADRLGVSDHTIKFHISSILDKLDASTRTEAVTTGLRMGLILL